MSAPVSRLVAVVGSLATLALSCDGASAGASIPVGFGSGTSSANSNSWEAGGHLGYNWQQGAAVFGFEADLQATNLGTSRNAILDYPAGTFIMPNDVANTTSVIDRYGTLRGQLGYASGPWLVYGTAGFAYGHVGLNTYFSTGGLAVGGTSSELKTGWTAGGGFKYMALPNVSVGLQYLYVDLGNINLAATGGPVFAPISFQSSTSGQFHTVTAGISYQFTPSNAAMPWQGAYAGIHGGGAWGNDTNATYIGPSPVVRSDARLKRDITLLARRSDGLGIYAYRYLWSDAVHVGVMAQEVALIHPAAIVRDELTGYMSVNYGMLD